MEKCRNNLLDFVMKNRSLDGSRPFFIKRFFLWIFSWFSSTRTTTYDLVGLVNANIKSGSRMNLNQVAYTLDNVQTYMVGDEKKNNEGEENTKDKTNKVKK